jgi:hypothetical protein
MDDRYERQRALLTETLPDLPLCSFVFRGEGTDHLAFDVNGEWLFRFAKAGAGAALAREARILRYVATLTPLPVPVPSYVRAEAGFMGYRTLPGAPLLDAFGDFGKLYRALRARALLRAVRRARRSRLRPGDRARRLCRQDHRRTPLALPLIPAPIRTIRGWYRARRRRNVPLAHGTPASARRVQPPPRTVPLALYTSTSCATKNNVSNGWKRLGHVW